MKLLKARKGRGKSRALIRNLCDQNGMLIAEG
jgi:hypothetical protein